MQSEKAGRQGLDNNLSLYTKCLGKRVYAWTIKPQGVKFIRIVNVQPFAEIQSGHKVAGGNSEYPGREDLVPLTVRVTWKNHAPTFALLAHPRSGQDPN
jgi:hypothetical protein